MRAKADNLCIAGGHRCGGREWLIVDFQLYLDWYDFGRWIRRKNDISYETQMEILFDDGIDDADLVLADGEVLGARGGGEA